MAVLDNAFHRTFSTEPRSSEWSETSYSQALAFYFFLAQQMCITPKLPDTRHELIDLAELRADAQLFLMALLLFNQAAESGEMPTKLRKLVQWECLKAHALIHALKPLETLVARNPERFSNVSLLRDLVEAGEKVEDELKKEVLDFVSSLKPMALEILMIDEDTLKRDREKSREGMNDVSHEELIRMLAEKRSLTQLTLRSKEEQVKDYEHVG